MESTTSKLTHFAISGLLLAAASAPALAQAGPEQGPRCSYLAPAYDAFLELDTNLRKALSVADPIATAFLIQFPVRVNGSTELSEPAFISRFDELFSNQARSEILAEPVEKLFCNDSGITYASGRLWLNWINFEHEDQEPRVAIVSINTLDNLQSSAEEEVLHLCEVPDRRFVVDHVGGNYRYREWMKPRFLTDTPDRTLTNGMIQQEGSGVCGHWSFTFSTVDQELHILDSGGCFSEADSSPALHGSLTIIPKSSPTANAPEQYFACY